MYSLYGFLSGNSRHTNLELLRHGHFPKQNSQELKISVKTNETQNPWLTIIRKEVWVFAILSSSKFCSCNYKVVVDRQTTVEFFISMFQNSVRLALLLCEFIS